MSEDPPAHRASDVDSLDDFSDEEDEVLIQWHHFYYFDCYNDMYTII